MANYGRTVGAQYQVTKRMYLAVRRLTTRFRKIPKPWGMDLKLPDCSDIWPTPRQQCWILSWYDHFNTQYRMLEPPRDLSMTRLIVRYSTTFRDNLTHFPLDKMAAILETTLTYAFSWIERKFCISIQISLKFAPKGSIDNNSALVRPFGAKPSHKPMLT